ncbi:MAG: lipase family protein [Verrucomicrobiota bacterium]
MPRFIEILPASTTGFFTALDALPVIHAEDPGAPANAWFCAEASALAYKSAAFVEEFSEWLGLRGWSVKTFIQEPTQAVLLSNGSLCVLAFRGTRLPGFSDLFRTAPVNFHDLGTDFAASLLSHPTRGRVHRGFFSAFSRFWKAHGAEILEAIEGKPFFVTGHSLGGALATLAARHLGSATALYTFGSPRVGDEDFRKGFEELAVPVFRFVHGFDLISTLPPAEIGYSHVGAMIHIDEKSADFTGKRQHSFMEAMAYNLYGLPATVGLLFRQIVGLQFLDLPNFQLPADALVEHAPINYCGKLHAAARRGC